jgi:hypothetical protein
LAAALRFLRRRRARRSLKRHLLELYGLDWQLAAATAELDYRLTHGVGWAGWAIWPEKLHPRLADLWHILAELGTMRARVRAQWAEGPIERLRDDIEHLVSLLRRATELYEQGTIECYRTYSGEPVQPSVTGQGWTLVLSGDAAIKEARELRETARLLFRSSAYQLGLKDRANKDVALWPVRDREAWALQSPYFAESRDNTGDPATDPHNRKLLNSRVLATLRNYRSRFRK